MNVFEISRVGEGVGLFGIHLESGDEGGSGVGRRRVGEHLHFRRPRIPVEGILAPGIAIASADPRRGGL